MTSAPQGWDATAWQEHVFCLISPDSVRRHLVTALLDRLAAEGFTPVGWRAVRITGSQIDAVAEIQRAGAGQTFRYRALDELFSLGPAIALRIEDGYDRPAERRYAVLKALKGGTPPNTRPGTLRHDLGSVNAVLSLLHISDTPENSARESAAILGDPYTVPLFHDSATLPGHVSMLESGLRRETRFHAEVLTAVRSRVAAALWDRLTDQGRDLVEELIAEGGLAAPKAGARIAAELRAAAGHPLAAVLAMTFDPSDRHRDIADVAATLSLHGCAFDTWERAVLATSMYFDPVTDPVTDPGTFAAAAPGGKAIL